MASTSFNTAQRNTIPSPRHIDGRPRLPAAVLGAHGVASPRGNASYYQSRVVRKQKPHHPGDRLLTSLAKYNCSGAGVTGSVRLHATGSRVLPTSEVTGVRGWAKSPRSLRSPRLRSSRSRTARGHQGLGDASVAGVRPEPSGGSTTSSYWAGTSGGSVHAESSVSSASSYWNMGQWQWDKGDQGENVGQRGEWGFSQSSSGEVGADDCIPSITSDGVVGERGRNPQLKRLIVSSEQSFQELAGPSSITRALQLGRGEVSTPTVHPAEVGESSVLMRLANVQDWIREMDAEALAFPSVSIFVENKLREAYAKQPVAVVRVYQYDALSAVIWAWQYVS
jgi:hypothetical protein